MEENKNIKVFGVLGLLVSVLVMLVLGLLFTSILLYVRPDMFKSTKRNVELKEALMETPIDVGGEIIDSVHVETGLVVGEGLQLVIANCTSCHSAKLVTQNRLTKEGWTQVIRWMQETQGLWDLGESEEQIIAYLSTHYPPEARGRRKALEVEWYDLD